MWGGARPGAGRKKRKGSGVPHTRREEFPERFPLHVTLKLSEGLRSLRRGAEYGVLCLALDSSSDREGFRVVHFSAQSNHVHLIVEARDKQQLARGVQGLKVRLAKGLNKLWRRRGAVFADRYHALLLKTPRQVRNALRYVLTNSIKHGLNLDPGEPDPFSSGDVVHGWNRIPDLELGWTSLGLVAAARTWLLRTGWRRHGLIPLPG